jgi:hypothetical protein
VIVRGATGVLLLVAGATAVWAHTGGSTGYASITVSRSTVRYRVILPGAVLPPDLADTLRLAQAGSEPDRDKLFGVLRTRIVLHSGATRCEPGPGQLARTAGDPATFTMRVDFACGSAVRELTVEDNIFDVLGPDHHTLGKIEGPSGIQEFASLPTAGRRASEWAMATADPAARAASSCSESSTS